MSERAVDGFISEVLSSGLLEHLADAEGWFRRHVRGRVRGRSYDFGGVTLQEGVELYSAFRALEPQIAVETGVCNGASTAFLLLAMERNGCGRLHSIDLPEFADDPTGGGAFWEGKGGAVVPRGRESGWAIPERLRERWALVLGRSQDRLPELLSALGSIDAFLHDSEHSYGCMTFELRAAHPHLRPGGLLLADDFSWNTAFADVAAELVRPFITLGGVAYLRV